MYIWIFFRNATQGCTRRVDDGLSPKTESADNSSNGGSLHALQPDVFTLIEFYLFKVALLIIFIAGLYRLVRKEVRRD